jgi:SNF2 family DNA or RNA helicase
MEQAEPPATTAQVSDDFTALAAPETRTLPAFDRPLQPTVRETPLLGRPPWVRTLGKLSMEVSTRGWRFPTPDDPVPKLRLFDPDRQPLPSAPSAKSRTHLKPPGDMVMFKDRLLYLLQPPLENLFTSRQVELPFQPYPYQVKGIAFLMPRRAALLADEMGLGKTAQVIVAIRLLLGSALIRRVLIVCPKPIVVNWTRELRTWAEDVPFEVVGGETQTRKAQWLASRCPVKLVNYELLTRDAEFLDDTHFDLVVLDEAQRIKNHESKTAQVVCSISRDRSWAMTGTPIENRVDDLVNIFAFIDPGRVPLDTPPRVLRELTHDSILRRVKEEVATDMPPKVVQDVFLELTAAQRTSYDRAENEGVIQLNALGDTIRVQHVFELVMRLKQICNFDPATGESAKLEQLVADVQEVAENGRKAIVFSQWVQPLEVLARALAPHGPLLYHGKIAQRDREPILERFKSDKRKHVLLMSYGTGSVGLNLQFTNYVFLFDRWWNPAVEDQAINRAHRIGQKNPVIVTRFISKDTIEERIDLVLRQKRELFASVLGDGRTTNASLSMTAAEIFGLFDLKSCVTVTPPTEPGASEGSVAA